MAYAAAIHDVLISSPADLEDIVGHFSPTNFGTIELQYLVLKYNCTPSVLGNTGVESILVQGLIRSP